MSRAVPAAPMGRTAKPWAETLFAWRDRFLGDPKAQRFLAGFPLTRGIAKRRAQALFDIAAGFVYSQVLIACVRADLFEAMATGPIEIDEIASLARLNRSGARRLAEAATSLELFAERGSDRYGLGELGAALRGNPGVAAMVEHNAVFYQDLSDSLGLLRGEGGPTRLSRFWPYVDRHGETSPNADAVADYSALMGASQGFIAEDVLDAVSMRGRRRLLDIGGGEGAFAAAALARHPELEAAVFDLPAVAARATERFQAAGLSARAQAFGGDARHDAPPVTADAVSLVRVLHDHDDAAARTFVDAARRALSPGGLLIVAEPMAGADGAGRAADAYFGLYLAAMGQGRARTRKEIARMLTEAGFVKVRFRRARRPLLAGVITAHAPSDV